MQSEHVIPHAELSLLPVVDGPDADKRWQTWADRGARADQMTARMMNRGFVVLLAALSTWLVFQLLT
jgi:hypothetical protein